METNTDIHPVDLFAGRKLREARLLRGLSQANLGKDLSEKITFQQIQKYERGTNRIAISRMYEFLNLLQLPIGYFLPLEMEAPLPLVNNREAALLDDFRKLAPQSQDAVTALLNALVGR